MRLWLGRACLVLGALLLIISAIGLFQRPSERLQPTYSWDRLDLGLDRQTQDYDSLLRYARPRVAGTNEQKALEILDIVSRRFVHGLSRENLFTAYPQQLGGSSLKAAYSPDRILRLGNEGFCSQQSYILTRLANDLGLSARQVGLNGHVVAEVWYDDDWHMLDPDYELAIRGAHGQIASVAELERDRPRLVSAYGSKAPAVIGFYQSRQDNASYPAGSYFVWKADVLLYVTQALQVFKWVFPLLLLAAGYWLLRGRGFLSQSSRSRKAAVDREARASW